MPEPSLTERIKAALSKAHDAMTNPTWTGAKAVSPDSRLGKLISAYEEKQEELKHADNVLGYKMAKMGGLPKIIAQGSGMGTDRPMISFEREPRVEPDLTEEDVPKGIK